MTNEDHISAMRALPRIKERTAYLQHLLGPKTTDPTVLHRNALLITALREAQVWPDAPRERKVAA